MKKVVSAVAIAASVSFPGVAADAPRDTVRLDEVMVTAPLKTNPDLIPMNVTQVTEAQIEKSGESSLLPVLVSRVPGCLLQSEALPATASRGAARAR